MRKGKTFIISGPSGVGKGTVVKALAETRKDVYVSISATTRAPRAGEENGVHYHFLDTDTFQHWIDRDEFLEHAEYVGNCYGTPKRYVDAAMEEGQDVILEIDVQGALQIAEKRPETVLIFILPPSWEELERRLTLRGTDSPDKIQKRLQRAKEEYQAAHAYQYFVVNDTVENAVRQVEAIMTAEHCKRGEHTAALACD